MIDKRNGRSLAIAAGLACLWGCGHEQGAVSEPGSDPLSWTVGKWEGTRFEPSTGERAPVRTQVTSILGGAGEQEQVSVQTGKSVYMGLYVQVFDPKLQKSVTMYVNSTRRAFARLEGVASGDRAEWESTTSQPPHRSKLVYERLNSDSWRRTQLVSEDNGRTWSVLFVDDLHRRPGT